MKCVVQFKTVCVLRWAQVTEELRQALWELEEEKEKRKHFEEKAHEQDEQKNKFSTLMEEQENPVMLGKETTASVLFTSNTSSTELEHNVVGELKSETALLVSSLQEMKQNGDCAKQMEGFRDDDQLEKLQVSGSVRFKVMI